MVVFCLKLPYDGVIMKPRTPERLDRRSQALKRLVAARLRARPELLTIGRDNIERWRDSEGKWGRHTPYMETWLAAIEQGVEACCILLEDVSQETQPLRQAAPFAGVIPERERREFLAQWEVNS